MEKKPGSKVTKKFHGDASKVTVRGPGIKKAFMNRAQNLTIDVKDAGMIHALCCSTEMDLVAMRTLIFPYLDFCLCLDSAFMSRSTPMTAFDGAI